HPVIGWIDGHWFGLGDDPATYANDYVQGCWVMWQARASLPVGVPDGYALVPVEPSVELLTAMSLSLGMHPLGDGADGSYPITGAQSTVMQCYRAILAAAPTVKAEQVPTPEFVWVRLLE